MKLALFDLDHTLLPFDSGMAWTRFLMAQGVLPAQAEAEYLAHCQAYVDGRINIRALHHATVSALRQETVASVNAWSLAFEASMATQLSADMQALVQGHLDAGHVCALVTATTRFIAEPLGRLFGLPHVLATQSAVTGDGEQAAYTGDIVGEPCHGAGKLVHVQAWLAEHAHWPSELAGFEQSWFYSDSFSDMPLLCAVSDPVAVRPDARLAAHAVQAGWRTLHSG